MAPMTNAERQKKYRLKLKQNSEQYEEKKKRHREYMRSVRQPIKELSEDQQKKIRLQWKAANEKRKQNKPDGSVPIPKRKCDKILSRIWRNRCLKLSNELKKFKELVQTLSRQSTSLKKKIYRLKGKLQNSTSQMNIKSATVPSDPVTPQALQNTNELTPMTKTNVFIEENISETVREEDKERVKKKILELHVIKQSIKNEYHDAADNQTKNVLKNLAINNVTQKYNMKTSLTKTLGLKGKIRKRIKTPHNSKEAEQIQAFFNRDDNSRMSAGKKECITHKKSKKQKRFQLQNIKKLHIKYVSEGGKASETTFRRNKPFYVVRPKLSDRDTCACLKHSNLLFKAQKLQKLGVLETHDLEELVIAVSCSAKSYNCMYSNCLNCKDKSPPLKTEIVNETECSWLQWELQEHKYTQNKDGTIGHFKTKKYVKAVKEGTVSELTSLFLKELVVFKKHFFNIQHQYAMSREVIDHLKENEACILIDFSENYQCKMSNEIQSLHFGASRVQVTLHTGIMYTKCQKPKSFVSVSPSNEHGPGAIWAHLEPVIDFLKKDFPEINVIHFFSDGPSTQYKQKKNFYQMCTLLEQNSFNYGTWSFFESAHGKGAADGVGGAVKRVMDQQVAYGRDIFSAMDAANTLIENTNIKVFYIPESKIKDKQSEIPGNLVPIPGTMRIHQIVFHGGKLSYRDISCFCGTLRGVCGCYNLKTHELEKQPFTNLSKQRSDKINKSKPRSTKNKTKSKIPKRKSRKCKIREMEITDTDSSNISYANTDDSPYDPEMSDDSDPIYQNTIEQNTYNLIPDSSINDMNASLAVTATLNCVNNMTDDIIQIPDQNTSTSAINDVTATMLNHDTSTQKHLDVLTKEPATGPKPDKHKIILERQSDSTADKNIAPVKIQNSVNSNKNQSARPQSQTTIRKPRLSPALKSPGTLQGFCINTVNRQVLCKNSKVDEKGVSKELNLVEFKQIRIIEQREHWDRDLKPQVGVCYLSDISKNDNQLLPFMVKRADDVPSCLKKQSRSPKIQILSDIIIPAVKQQNSSKSEPLTIHPANEYKICKRPSKNIRQTLKDNTIKVPNYDKPGPSGMCKGSFIAEKKSRDEWDSIVNICEIPAKHVISAKNLECITLKGKGIGKRSTGNKNRQPEFQAKSKLISSKDSTTKVSGTISTHSDSDIFDVYEDLATDDEWHNGINTEILRHGLVEDPKRNQNTDEYPYNDLKTDEIVGDPTNDLVTEETTKNEKTDEYLNNDLKNEETENNKKPAEYFINDHVLFKYFCRNKCTYYIGLIETKTEMGNDEPIFMIKFLKTIKKPKLVFRMAKIVDRAEISQNSVVKKVDLVQNPVKSNEYMLSGEENTVYF